MSTLSLPTLVAVKTLPAFCIIRWRPSEVSQRVCRVNSAAAEGEEAEDSIGGREV